MNPSASTLPNPAPSEPDASGSACPLEYRYGPRAFRTAQTDRVHTAYIIGGLYGNVEALHAIEAMRQREADQGTDVTLVFNGDYNWFDIDDESFRTVNQAALNGLSIRGNVEAELDSPNDDGCGCNYPDYFNADYVAQSNAIMARLRATGRRHPDLLDQLRPLPFIRVIEVGSSRIGILHGDAESLSGWSFAAERLSPTGKCCSGDEALAPLTPLSVIERCFREADVHAFASSHTCLAHAKDFEVDGTPRLIINNGAAGLPNFAGQSEGLITRISSDITVPADSLYGITLNGVRYDALPVRFDAQRWTRRFLANWPSGSIAHTAYWQRMQHGPDFTLADAMGGQVRAT